MTNLSLSASGNLFYDENDFSYELSATVQSKQLQRHRAHQVLLRVASPQMPPFLEVYLLYHVGNEHRNVFQLGMEKYGSLELLAYNQPTIGHARIDTHYSNYQLDNLYWDNEKKMKIENTNNFTSIIMVPCSPSLIQVLELEDNKNFLPYSSEWYQNVF